MTFYKPHYIYTVFLLFIFTSIRAQFIINDRTTIDEISLHNYTSFIDVGKKTPNIQYIIKNYESLNPIQLTKKIEYLGFSANNFWAKTTITNVSSKNLTYFLESAGPTIYVAELYAVNTVTGKITKSVSGINTPVSQRNVDNPKTMFRLNIPRNSTIKIFVHLRSDGNAVKMQSILKSGRLLTKATLFEQFIFGVYYGMILFATIIFFFIFYYLKEKSIFWYSSYFVCIGLMQLTIDGYYNNIKANTGYYLLDYPGLLFALFAQIFLIQYLKSFLKLKTESRWTYNTFNIVLGLVFLMIISIFSISSLLIYYYQLANILGFLIVFITIATIIYLRCRNKTGDIFFEFGIFFITISFIIFILNNFGLIFDTFFSRNVVKFGTTLELFFLSISMAIWIKNLRENQINLNKLNLERAEEVLNIKSHLLSSMSHELRTPLNAILNLTGFITQETVNPVIKKNSEVIALTSSTLLDSINNILDYYKIENGELKFTETSFSLEKLLSQINKNVKKQAKLKKLSFEFYVSGNIFIFCFGDPHRLKQVINIAISNALKYTLKGKIELHIEAEIADNNNINLTITIKDTGVGMNNERLNTVFQFINVIESDNKRNFGGLGVGLYIAKKIIAIQKGNIHIVTNLGKGTSCIIKLTFPVVNNSNSKIPETDKKYNLIEKNILVIEDNEINQLVIKMITKNWLNTRVSFANNGQLGIAELQLNKYDIVLMDLQMPVMDGFEATTIIRTGGAGAINKNIPIIAVSADTAEKTKQRVIDIGMNHYLSKPLNKDILYKTINDLLKKEYLLRET